jgi:hypothetical protein
MMEEELMKQKVPKLNKKSMEILKQRQERLDQEKIKKDLMTNGIENPMMFDDEHPNTSRL